MELVTWKVSKRACLVTEAHPLFAAVVVAVAGERDMVARLGHHKAQVGCSIDAVAAAAAGGVGDRLLEERSFHESCSLTR